MEKIDVTKELAQNFIDYAVAVNTDRSIPSAIDGLKPVARRILWGAYTTKRLSSKPHVKWARLVGDVMGTYHPHGDTSIYDAGIRLSQDWVMRYPLMDTHGNNGNIIGDGAAAMRYTEGRLASLSEKGLLQTVNESSEFVPNYDETSKEPIALPSVFPNLLCNPNMGIGVALGCHWLPHNLREVAETIKTYVATGEVVPMMPDFPTGGIIINKDELPAIVKAGRGSVKVRGTYEIKKDTITFTSIPYEQSVESIMTELGLVCGGDNPKVVGVSEVYDITDKKGVKIVIKCENEGIVGVVLNGIFANTSLQSSISYNQVALVGKTPVELNLEQCIQIYLDSNQEFIQREYGVYIDKAKARLHIVEGLLKALASIDEIIAGIKNSQSSAAAKEWLIVTYDFSEVQAKAILAMRLSSLAKLEGVELNKESDDLKKNIAAWQDIVSDRDKRIDILLERLDKVVKEFGDERRTQLTQIQFSKQGVKTKQSAEIVTTDVVVIRTKGNVIKSVPRANFRTQRRAAKGVKVDEVIEDIHHTNTADSLLLFSDKGIMYRLPVKKIPSTPIPIEDLIELNGENIIASTIQEVNYKYVTFVTAQGRIKKTNIEEFKTNRNAGVKAIKLKEGDSIANVFFINDEDILIVSCDGHAIRFSSKEIEATKRDTMGVIGMKLSENDTVLTGYGIKDDDKICVVTKKGYSNLIAANEIPITKRAAKGIILTGTKELIGDVVVYSAAIGDNTTLLVNCWSGTNKCISLDDLKTYRRGAQGLQVAKGEQVRKIALI